MAHLLGAENIGIAFGTRTVLEGLSLGVDEGDRIGLVGRNGDGKSTLMRILAGLQEPDTGRVTRRGGVRVGVLDQQDRLDPEHTVRQAVVGDVDDHVWASGGHPCVVLRTTYDELLRITAGQAAEVG